MLKTGALLVTNHGVARIASPTKFNPLTRSALAFIEIPEQRKRSGVKASGPTSTTMSNILQRTGIASLAILMGLFASERSVAAPPPAAYMNQVTLTAWLDVDGGLATDVIVEVDVNGTKDWGRPDDKGRVDLVLPADAVAMISFRKPGHLTKMVSVDTHNMEAGAFKGKQRNLAFGVKLDAITDNEGLVYAGPVGVLAFAANGDVMVEHDQQLVPERQQKTVVF